MIGSTRGRMKMQECFHGRDSPEVQFVTKVGKNLRSVSRLFED
jgi:hypothetical protein